jgi:hypothetical protein
MTDLTKWPRLIVVPTKLWPLTGQQANEILLRTNGYMMSNDWDWEHATRTWSGSSRRPSPRAPRGNAMHWPMSA